MKRLAWTLGILVMTSGLAAAQDVNELVPAPEYQATAERSALDKALIANEHKINEAVAKGDKAAFTALVSAGATSLDGMGVMKVSEFAEMLNQMKITSWKLSDEKVSWVDSNTAIVTAKWTGAGTFQGQPVPPQTYSSTVWTKKGDKWVAVFHQESAAIKK
jgi:hypothetical protein